MHTHDFVHLVRVENGVQFLAHLLSLWIQADRLRLRLRVVSGPRLLGLVEMTRPWEAGQMAGLWKTARVRCALWHPWHRLRPAFLLASSSSSCSTELKVAGQAVMVNRGRLWIPRGVIATGSGVTRMESSRAGAVGLQEVWQRWWGGGQVGAAGQTGMWSLLKAWEPGLATAQVLRVLLVLLLLLLLLLPVKLV